MSSRSCKTWGFQKCHIICFRVVLLNFELTSKQSHICNGILPKTRRNWEWTQLSSPTLPSPPRRLRRASPCCWSGACSCCRSFRSSSRPSTASWRRPSRRCTLSSRTWAEPGTRDGTGCSSVAVDYNNFHLLLLDIAVRNSGRTPDNCASRSPRSLRPSAPCLNSCCRCRRTCRLSS